MTSVSSLIFFSSFFICICVDYWFSWVNFSFRHVMKMIINCLSIPVEILGSLMYTILLFANKDTLTFFLYNLCPFCISFSCLTALGNISRTIFYRIGKSVLFLLLIKFLWICFHLSWWWLWFCYKLTLLCLEIFLVSWYSPTILSWRGVCQQTFLKLREKSCFFSFSF